MIQTENDGVTPYLPEDVITNILKRLPVRSLIRFQSVCKHWKNLIKFPSFIADHLHHSSHQNPSIFLPDFRGTGPLQLCLLDCGMQVCEVIKGPPMGSWQVRIISSSNGLLCVEFNDYGTSPWSLLLWNPSIREVRHVPRTVHDFEGVNCLGFGFSPVINDYKIVRTYAKPVHVVNRVEVYSLNTGLWKEIDLGNIEGVRLYPETVTANGAMFWLGLKVDAKEGEGNIKLIVSFDIAAEVFTLIPMPILELDRDIYYICDPRLMVYENKFGILCNIMIGEFESRFVSLWLMEEGSCTLRERWSLIKKYTRCLNPVTIWRDEIVYMNNGPFVDIKYEVEHDPEKTILSLFNINTGEFRWLAIHSHGPNQHIFNYTESLVPVGNIHIKEPLSKTLNCELTLF